MQKDLWLTRTVQRGLTRFFLCCVVRRVWCHRLRATGQRSRSSASLNLPISWTFINSSLSCFTEVHSHVVAPLWLLLTLYSSVTFTSNSTWLHMTAGTKVVTADLSSLVMLLFLFVSRLLNGWFVLHAVDSQDCLKKHCWSVCLIISCSHRSCLQL